MEDCACRIYIRYLLLYGYSLGVAYGNYCLALVLSNVQDRINWTGMYSYSIKAESLTIGYVYRVRYEMNAQWKWLQSVDWRREIRLLNGCREILSYRVVTVTRSSSGHSVSVEMYVAITKERCDRMNQSRTCLWESCMLWSLQNLADLGSCK